MTARGFCLAAVFLSVFPASLAWLAPAGWVLYGFRQYTGADLGWAAADGTWRSAVIHDLEIGYRQDRRLDFKRARYRITPLPLLLGRLDLEYRLETGNGVVTGNLQVQDGAWEISELHGDLPFSELAPVVFSSAVADNLQARLRLHGKNLGATSGITPRRGNLEIRLTDLKLEVGRAWLGVGTHDLHLAAAAEGQMRGRLHPGDDSLLRLTGELVVDFRSDTLQLTGEARAAEHAPAEIRALLPLLGRADGNRVDLDWQTPL